MSFELPYVIQPDSAVDITSWVSTHLDEIKAMLKQHGALLLRGFGSSSERAFRDVVDICCGRALKYLYRSTPRTDLGDNIYTATEYPAGLRIPFHSENSFQREWPLLLLFFCALPASGAGGQTPLADIEKVTERIDLRIRQKFLEKKVMYIRNFSKDIDLPWQVVFQTESRVKVEEFCRSREIIFEWTRNDNLRTRQVCQSFARNPATGKIVWFNQAHLFHPSSLDTSSREILSELFSSEDYPRNALYGDGSSLDESDLDHIRRAFDQEAKQFEWQIGDVLFLDNMRTAHSRLPYKGKRRILTAMGWPSSSEAVKI